MMEMGNMKLVVTVGIGVNKNDFGVKVIDDGDGEDVTNGEGVNER